MGDLYKFPRLWAADAALPAGYAWLAMVKFTAASLGASKNARAAAHDERIVPRPPMGLDQLHVCKRGVEVVAEELGRAFEAAEA